MTIKIPESGVNFLLLYPVNNFQERLRGIIGDFRVTSCDPGVESSMVKICCGPITHPVFF